MATPKVSEADARRPIYLVIRTQNQPSDHQTPGSDVRPESSGSPSGGGVAIDAAPPSASAPVVLAPLASQRGKFVVYLWSFWIGPGRFSS